MRVGNDANVQFLDQDDGDNPDNWYDNDMIMICIQEMMQTFSS